MFAKFKCFEQGDISCADLEPVTVRSVLSETRVVWLYYTSFFNRVEDNAVNRVNQRLKILLLLSLLFVGCGQSGDLYLPDSESQEDNGQAQQEKKE